MKNDKIINDYLNYLLVERKLSDNSITRFKYVINSYLKYIKKDLIESDNADIISYIKSLSKIEKPTSINNSISIIKSLYTFMFLNKIINKNEVEYIKSMKMQKKLPNVLSVSQVDDLLDIKLNNKFDYRNKAALELMYGTGLRVSEIVSLKIGDIDFENDILKTITKGRKDRIIPINETAINYLNEYINNYRNLFLNGKTSEYLFLNSRGTMLTRNAFNFIINTLCLSKNILVKVTPHTLRHSFATHMIENGADIRSVQELMGHENVTTTEIYTHISNKFLKENYEEYFMRNEKR